YFQDHHTLQSMEYNRGMPEAILSNGTVHQLPDDMRQSILKSPQTVEIWNSLTALGRNEYICWVESAKQQSTRERRIQRANQEMLDGLRRPCCWIGCIHRPDKAISPSVQAIL